MVRECDRQNAFERIYIDRVCMNSPMKEQRRGWVRRYKKGYVMTVSVCYYLANESECRCIASTSALISLIIDFNRSFSSINKAAACVPVPEGPWVV